MREARNAVMHSASKKMSNAYFLAHTDAMIAEDPLFIDKIKEAQDAVTEIQKAECIVLTQHMAYTDGIKLGCNCK